MTRVLWFRRDLRTTDHPALAAASSNDSDVLGLFVIDPSLWRNSGNVRLEWLRQSLQALNEQLAGNLWIARGDPSRVVPAVANEVGASQVHISEDFGTYGKDRDRRVKIALAEQGVDLISDGSPYAVNPGSVLTGGQTRYRVYTPYYRQWLAHGWPEPVDSVIDPHKWITPPTEFNIGHAAELHTPLSTVGLPAVGELAAWERWESFQRNALADYHDHRNRPDLDGTSSLSAHLRWGEIHPRSLLRDIAPHLTVPETESGATTFRKEIAWREFYADVWDANPSSARSSLDTRFDSELTTNTGAEADKTFTAWQAGRTGFPFVDAGMRQLLATGWMHNRVRMVTASFLVKGLHLPWQRGAAHFMALLRDADAASNQHGWQWVAGCGTDAAPFHRIFNPVKQGLTFDPNGHYVRQWIPEIRELNGAIAHEPWKVRGTLSEPHAFTYPMPIIDHATERKVALERFAVLPPRNA